MKAALGIRDDYKDGTSFNQELQAAHRAEEKAAKEAQRLEEEIAREKEKRKTEKEREKEEKAKRSKERHKKKRLVINVYSDFLQLYSFRLLEEVSWRVLMLFWYFILLIFYSTRITKSNIYRIVRNDNIIISILYSCQA